MKFSWTIQTLCFIFYKIVPRPLGAPSQAQLAALTDGWWKWIFSVDTSRQRNPFTSFFTGDCSVLLQPGNRIFLVGTASPGGGVQNHGTCNVPAKTSVLFSILNSECSFFEFPTLTVQTMGEPFKQLRSCTDVSGANNSVASLDGAPLKSTRVQSRPGGFQLTIVPNNPLAG